MHQPYYKDDLSNRFLLPWVRLRCAKDYYKMPALLADYPSIKQTFNLVPALVAQVQDYADSRFSDVYLELARRPVGDLNADERAFVARWMTESSQIRRVREYPRYAELVRKREQAWPRGSLDLARLFSDAELRDLQVWFNLSWIGPEVMERDPAIGELVRKGRDFVEADKEPIFRLQLELLRPGGADHESHLPSHPAADRRPGDRPGRATGPRHAAPRVRPSGGCRRTAAPWRRVPHP